METSNLDRRGESPVPLRHYPPVTAVMGVTELGDSLTKLAHVGAGLITAVPLLSLIKVWLRSIPTQGLRRGAANSTHPRMTDVGARNAFECGNLGNVGAAVARGVAIPLSPRFAFFAALGCEDRIAQPRSSRARCC